MEDARSLFSLPIPLMAATTTMSSSSVKKLQPPPLPPPSTNDVIFSSSSSSDDDSDAPNVVHSHEIFKPYLQVYGSSSPDLSKIQSFLLASRSGALSCLICLERVRRTDPVWSCSARCYAIFHLLCIQNWARQVSNRPPTSAHPLPNRSWHCPKCRTDYPHSLVPRLYLCFCGKVENPPSDPWIVPHSCGEICGRRLRSGCGHECLLLCHPGPCPSCPKLIRTACFCGSVVEVRRCGSAGFSCTGTCPRLLTCGIHRCEEGCHEGPCPPCQRKGVFRCLCGKKAEERECCESEFRCENHCSRLLDCGKHACDRGCHPGGCGECPLRGRRMCPCGKVEYKGIGCDVVAPTCGSTCEKKLSCGLHRCPERCHQGSCIETCRTVLIKSCRCGSLKKEFPCHQDLVCERKCQRPRNCGRHACKRRCCDGDCSACPEVCGRKLRCNNHKCPSPCHSGACAPCPLMVTIACFCGESHFEVPCGVEKDQKPPKCSKACSSSRLCRHASSCKPHRCHYGACPPCRLICEEKLPCGHICKRRCHGPVPAAKPEFTLQPKRKRAFLQTSNIPGTPCPACEDTILLACLGKHIGVERMMICSKQKPFACENLCGTLLNCGNHYCTKPCHLITATTYSGAEVDSLSRQVFVPTISATEVPEPCEECILPCQKERVQKCPHPCPLPCHIGDCPPCNVLIKRACHCGAMVHVFECTYFNSMHEQEQQQVRSCGGPCHRKLANCTHLCSMTCHHGPCQSSENCCKKVTVRCTCQNVRKEWLCKDVQAACRNFGHDLREMSKSHFGFGILPCNSDCKKTCKSEIGNDEVKLRKTMVTENKENDACHAPRRRKRHERKQESRHVSKFQVLVSVVRKLLLVTLVVALTTVAAYFGLKGLFRLSDWMNEIEERRMRRYPKF